MMRNLVFVLAIIVSMASVLNAATLTVTKTADTDDGVCDADCSLREALSVANGSVDDDGIIFDPLVFATEQTIMLSSGELIVANNGTLSLFGPDAIVTINPGGASRALTVEEDADVDILGIRFANGNGAGAANTGRGGAIYNNGGITLLENVIIVGNTATNGGGLNNANGGQLTIINTVIMGNQALTSSGGGLQNFSSGTLNIEGALIAGNISNSSSGGGGAQLNGTVNISNTTFANNEAASGGDGGGISSNGTSLTLTNVTMSGNIAGDLGGGLRRVTTNTSLFVRNSIFAGNTAATADNDVSTNSSLTSRGNNIIGDAGNSAGWIKSDQLDTDPLLGPLADNGGFSETFLPMVGSPAIDGGQDCVIDQSCMDENAAFDLNVDQRDIIRPQGDGVDIGATEIAGSSAVTVFGRVVDALGSGVANAGVSIGGQGVIGGGPSGTTRTNSFGFFAFPDVQVGQGIAITASKKEKQFGTELVTVSEKMEPVVISEIVDELGEIRFRIENHKLKKRKQN